MKVLKFGGTSVGSASRIKELKSIITKEEKVIVVLSAMSGTTNKLDKICKYLQKGDKETARGIINELKSEYLKTIGLLFASNEYLQMAKDLVLVHFTHIESFLRLTFSSREEKIILSKGELLSTALLYYYFLEQEIDSYLLSAFNFMRIDKEGEPDTFYIKEQLTRELNLNKECNIFITQGYVCRNSDGFIDNLNRGGSDYSASLIGEAISADEVQIWTDIDGFHNNDPRHVANTKSIKELSFDQAAELAYFGAKILHPASINPCKHKNIKVRLKNTLNPKKTGTIISQKTNKEEIKAVAAKDNITVINIQSGRMLLAYGFLRKVFEIFEIYKTPIDMITTSEVAVSVSIDNVDNLGIIIKELEKYGDVNIHNNQSIICIVGNFKSSSKGNSFKILKALENIPLRMISYGGSEHNMSVLLNSDRKKEALQMLSNNLF